MIFATFHSSISPKTNIKMFKICNNSFTGAKAVAEMQTILSSLGWFDSPTYHQAKLLLDKFLSSHMIEDVHGKWKNKKMSNSRRKLYRFPPLPQQPFE
ncbi:DEP domain-containing protein 1B-like [Styela clava]